MVQAEAEEALGSSSVPLSDMMGPDGRESQTGQQLLQALGPAQMRVSLRSSAINAALFHSPGASLGPMPDPHKAFFGQFQSSAALDAFTAALVRSGYADAAAASA